MMRDMVIAGFVFFSCLILGMGLKYISGVAVPAPVFGLLCLFVWLVILGRVPRGVRLVSYFLVRHMGLFFIPILVGLLGLKSLLLDSGVVILLALIPSTILAVVVTAHLFIRFAPPLARVSGDEKDTP